MEPPKPEYDVAIVGGGVVGCAVFFELSRQGYACVLLEKNDSIMSEASSGNSGILHTGFDAPTGSVELDCIKACQAAILGVTGSFNVPVARCGAMLVAWEDRQKPDMARLLEETRLKGLASEIEELSLSNVYRTEPNLGPGAKGALYVPNESVVDSGLLGVCLAQHAILQGGQVYTNCQVLSVKDGLTLVTTRGPVRAKVTINCAGLWGDTVDALVGLRSFSVKPRKGQYCVYDQCHGQFFKSILFPMPTEKTKGIAVFKSVYNNVIAGPTAEDVQGRRRPLFDGRVHDQLRQTARQTIPGLSGAVPVGSYCGLRPATEHKDYQMRAHPDRNWITVGGIRSTGVSGSLGIAQHVTDLVTSEMGLEPSNGRSRSLEPLEWHVNDDRRSVTVAGCRYEMNHPIFLYGHMSGACKL